MNEKKMYKLSLDRGEKIRELWEIDGWMPGVGTTQVIRLDKNKPASKETVANIHFYKVDRQARIVYGYDTRYDRPSHVPYLISDSIKHLQEEILDESLDYGRLFSRPAVLIQNYNNKEISLLLKEHDLTWDNTELPETEDEFVVQTTIEIKTKKQFEAEREARKKKD